MSVGLFCKIFSLSLTNFFNCFASAPSEKNEKCIFSLFNVSLYVNFFSKHLVNWGNL